jgi:hypothetical protein
MVLVVVIESAGNSVGVVVAVVVLFFSVGLIAVVVVPFVKVHPEVADVQASVAIWVSPTKH